MAPKYTGYLCFLETKKKQMNLRLNIKQLIAHEGLNTEWKSMDADARAPYAAEAAAENARRTAAAQQRNAYGRAQWYGGEDPITG